MEFVHQKNNGIFKYLYNNNLNYYSQFAINAIYDTDHHSTYAFDWTTSYWYAGHSTLSQEQSTLEFCFNGRRVNLTGYEITTSDMTCRPKTWNFTASNDKTSWTSPDVVSHSMGSREVYYRDYSPGTFRCFKLIPTTYLSHNECKSYAFDIDQIELFGTLYTDPEKQMLCTFHLFHFSPVYFNLLFILYHK